MNGVLTNGSRSSSELRDTSPNSLVGKVRLANELASSCIATLAKVHETISGPVPSSADLKEKVAACYRSDFDLLLDKLRQLNDGLMAADQQFNG